MVATSTGCSMTSILLLGVGRAVDSPSDIGSLLRFLDMLSLSRPKESNHQILKELSLLKKLSKTQILGSDN